MADITNDIIALTKELISIKSTPANTSALTEVLKVAVKWLPDFPAQWFQKNDIPSCLISNSSHLSKKFRIIINGHLDVVPADDSMFLPNVHGGRIYGRGALDMKGAVAVQLLAFRDLANKLSFPFGLQLVTDEETGGFNGTAFQIEQGITPEFVLCGEPTKLSLVPKSKGLILGVVKANGVSAHSAFPWRGNNAILKMADYLNSHSELFLNFVDEKGTTVNPGRIYTSNCAHNKVPEDCFVDFDIRYSSDEEPEDVISRIKSTLPVGFEFTTTRISKAMATTTNNSFFQQLAKSYLSDSRALPKIDTSNYMTDLRFYSDKNIPAVLFGPDGDGMHSQNEYVEISSLVDYYNILTTFLLESNLDANRVSTRDTETIPDIRIQKQQSSIKTPVRESCDASDNSSV